MLCSGIFRKYIWYSLEFLSPVNDSESTNDPPWNCLVSDLILNEWCRFSRQQHYHRPEQLNHNASWAVLPKMSPNWCGYKEPITETATLRSSPAILAWRSGMTQATRLLKCIPGLEMYSLLTCFVCDEPFEFGTKLICKERYEVKWNNNELLRGVLGGRCISRNCAYTSRGDVPSVPSIPGSMPGHYNSRQTTGWTPGWTMDQTN